MGQIEEKDRIDTKVHKEIGGNVIVLIVKAYGERTTAIYLQSTRKESDGVDL
jgi:hypothetical protein